MTRGDGAVHLSEISQQRLPLASSLPSDAASKLATPRPSGPSMEPNPGQYSKYMTRSCRRDLSCVHTVQDIQHRTYSTVPYCALVDPRRDSHPVSESRVADVSCCVKVGWTDIYSTYYTYCISIRKIGKYLCVTDPRNDLSGMCRPSSSRSVAYQPW